MSVGTSALEPTVPAPTVAWHPEERWGDSPWAHCSGWMQLSGQRQRVSCVIPCHNQRVLLQQLLPHLADTLTECGYPWEVLLMDSASHDGSFELLQPWSRIPGFRLGSISAPASRALATQWGLRAARGDAVIVLDPTAPQALRCVNQAIERWDEGERVVCAGRACDQQPLDFVATPRLLSAGPDLLSDGRALVLLSRPVVQELLQAFMPRS